MNHDEGDNFDAYAAIAAFDALADDFDAAEELALMDDTDRSGHIEATLARMERTLAQQEMRQRLSYVRLGLDGEFDRLGERLGRDLSGPERANILALAQAITQDGHAPDLEGAVTAMHGIAQDWKAAPPSLPPTADEAAAPGRPSIESIDFNNSEERVRLLAERIEHARQEAAAVPSTSSEPPDIAA